MCFLVPPPPIHLGAASVLALALLRYVYLPAVLLGSLAPDIQPIIIVLFNVPYSFNGPVLHSLIGGTLLLPPLVIAIIFVLRKPLDRVTSFLELYQEPTLPRILAGTLIGVYSHILLDAYLYTDIQPFYPLDVNLLLSQSASRYIEMYTAGTITIIVALLMYGFHRRKKHNTDKSDKSKQ